MMGDSQEILVGSEEGIADLNTTSSDEKVCRACLDTSQTTLIPEAGGVYKGLSLHGKKGKGLKEFDEAIKICSRSHPIQQFLNDVSDEMNAVPPFHVTSEGSDVRIRPIHTTTPEDQ